MEQVSINLNKISENEEVMELLTDNRFVDALVSIVSESRRRDKEWTDNFIKEADELLERSRKVSEEVKKMLASSGINLDGI